MSGFVEELKRRNVVRVGLAYLVFGWLVLQVADVVFPALDMPEWTISAVTVLLAIGFVPALIFSWVYELTPEGIKREADIDPSESITAHTAKRLDIAIVILLLGTIGLVAWDRFNPSVPEKGSESFSSAASTATEATKNDSDPFSKSELSIAVLPFADMSPAGDQGYFADGLAEELLNVLARVDDLKVAARTSSFKFRGENSDISQIGQALGVGHVLEGSVRKAGDQIRVTAQLIDVNGGFHLWSDSYDRTLDNVFAIQDEIASSIVDALKLELEIGSLPAGETTNVEAFDLYLRARELAREPNKDGLLRAIRYYEQALELDPDFAQALGGIAAAWLWLEDYGGIPGSEAFPKAEAAARRALEIDPKLAEALSAIGFVMDRANTGTPTETRVFFEQALEANPSYVEAYTLYGDVLLDLGEMDKALEIRRRAVEVDPLSTFLKSRLANGLRVRGLEEAAEEVIDNIFEAAPEDTYGYEELANLRSQQRRPADAIRHYRFVHENRPGDPFSAAQIAIIYAEMGALGKAAEWVDAARARGENNRWELIARQKLAETTGDWDSLARLGLLIASPLGLSWQGFAATAQGDWEAARSAFLASLNQYGYDPGDAISANLVEPLLGLALAEQRLGVENWQQRAGKVRMLLTRIRDDDGVVVARRNLPHMEARVEALAGNSDQVVSLMREALDIGFNDPTFLELDPFFSELRDDPELQAIAEQIRAHNRAELQKLESRVGES
ncbi:MAG: tetratricopeptide repeat protein [Xanthomonadales bacterium]|nr:tetratricopeptide repeat protein [Xanthomonadales bacterium]